jgi:hypothetical protein
MLAGIEFIPAKPACRANRKYSKHIKDSAGYKEYLPNKKREFSPKKTGFFPFFSNRKICLFVIANQTISKK